MNDSSDTISDERVFQLTFNVFLRLSLVALLMFFSFMILRPFMIIIVWAVILAVALEGVFDKLCGMVGGRRSVAAVIFSIVAITLLVYPSYQIGESLLGSVRVVREAMDEGTLQAPPPPDWLGNLPLAGEQVYDAWFLASENAQQAVELYELQIRAAGLWLLGILAGLGTTVLGTIVALIIAAVFLNYSESATRALRAVTARIQGDWDEDVVGLAGATINSVARGVLGVALAQAVFCGAGLLLVGFPGAGLLTIVILVLAIVQFPVIVPMALPLVWGFANMSTPGHRIRDLLRFRRRRRHAAEGHVPRPWRIGADIGDPPRCHRGHAEHGDHGALHRRGSARNQLPAPPGMAERERNQ